MMMLVVSMLGWQTDGARGHVAGWLDETRPAAWNRPGLTIPAAPAVQGSTDPRCQEQTRPPQLIEDRRVHDQGWDLVGAFEGGWAMVVIGGAAGYDGMCRPRQYQHFVFVEGVFAGTLAPQPMESRSDGALSRVVLQGRNRLTAEYVRYTAADPLCCPSKATSVVFEVTEKPPVVTPLSAATSKR
jgi:hypothetical protein